MKRITMLAAAIALVAGVSACGGSNNTALVGLQHKLKAERASNATLQGRVASLQSQLATAQDAATHATAIADQKASAAYTSRNAALNQRAASLDAQAKTVAAEEGDLQANTISASGVYVVGHDIKSGTWHTNGDNGVGGDACYFATLNSANTSDIADNNNFDGPETVDVSGAYALEISGPCTWVLVS